MTIDQLFFGWNDRYGQMGVLNHSFATGEEADVWQSRLLNHVRLSRVQGGVLPRSALSYFVFPEDRTAAVLRRVPDGVNAGRNNSHALVGPSALLTPRAALLLSGWQRWLSAKPDGRMTPLSPDLVAGAPERVAQQLRPLARERRSELVAMLSAQLEAPSAPLGVIGSGELGGPALIWGLLEIAERTRIVRECRTFSTYEAGYDVADGLPDVVFLPERPYETGGVDRTVVDLSRSRPAGLHEARAVKYCDQLLDDALPAPAGPSPRRPEPAPVEPVPLEPVPPEQPLLEPVPPVPTTAARTPEPVERTPAAILADPRHLQEFAQTLAELRRRPRSSRPALRAQLDVATLDRVARHVEIGFRLDLFRQLAEAMYGRDLEDLAEPPGQEHARKLVAKVASDQLAILVSRAKTARRTPIEETAFERFVLRAGSMPTEPAAALARRLRDAGRSRRMPLVAGLAAVAVIGLAFLGGLLVARPGSDAGAAVVPGPATSSSPVATATTPPGPALVGGVPYHVPMDRRLMTLVAFHSGTGKYRIEGPCLPMADDDWICPSSGDPAAGPLVAFAVPNKGLGDALGQRVARAKGEGWIGPHPVG